MNFESVDQKKAHYAFKEIASITGVKPYVLRFWENEFDQISPIITGDGVKNYSAEDLKCVKQIKDLLFERKLSIDEAKFILAGGDIDDLKDEKEAQPKKTKIPLNQFEDNKVQLGQSLSSHLSREENVHQCLLDARELIEAIILKRSW